MSEKAEPAVIETWRDAAPGRGAGGRFLLVDASAGPEILATLSAQPFAYASLFHMADLTVLADEAPYIVDLGPDGAGDEAADALRQSLMRQNAAIGMSADGDLTLMRRHFRKWLTVRLPENREKVMFRFCDAHILAAFLMLLPAADAKAFFGPVRSFHLPTAQGERVFELGSRADATEPTRLGPGEYYQITPVQMQRFEEVTGARFKDDLFRFFRATFPDELRHLDDAALRRQIDLGIADADRMGDLRPGSVLTVEAVRLLRPDIIDDPHVWKEVMEKNALSGDPLMRAAILEAYLTSDFRSLQEREAYNAAIDRFWQGDF